MIIIDHNNYVLIGAILHVHHFYVAYVTMRHACTTDACINRRKHTHACAHERTHTRTHTHAPIRTRVVIQRTRVVVLDGRIPSAGNHFRESYITYDNLAGIRIRQRAVSLMLYGT